MAERRMFSKRVINSARFLKMPVSTQNLYFHLGLNADDDGIVEAYMIMNIIGAKEDDLKVLVSKNFVQILNADLVTYIIDWRENNSIRPDRKTDSIYKQLLLQVNPNVEILESKERTDRKKAPTEEQPRKNEVLDVNGTSQGQPMGRIGEVSLDKDRKEKDNIYIKIKDKYNSTCKELASVKIITDKRKKVINARISDYGLDTVLEVIDIVSKSSFLCNSNNTNNWKASFDWIMNPNNFVKILEGNYDNSDNKSKKDAPIYDEDGFEIVY